MTTYLMPWAYGEAEYIEKRSRFIGHVWPVTEEAEALAHIKAMREKHWDATHNVYAYILRENGVMRYSDDGEPGGTSGQPTLNVFRAGNIENVCCVVTRYFGGTLLGSGGLVRAYSTTARMALDAAGVSCMALWKGYHLSCAYAQYERVKRLLTDTAAVTEATDFAADVQLDVLVRQDKAEAFLGAVTELSAGTITCAPTAESFRGVRVEK